jgi:hypothetical protein
MNSRLWEKGKIIFSMCQLYFNMKSIFIFESLTNIVLEPFGIQAQRRRQVQYVRVLALEQVRKSELRALIKNDNPS